MTWSAKKNRQIIPHKSPSAVHKNRLVCAGLARSMNEFCTVLAQKPVQMQAESIEYTAGRKGQLSGSQPTQDVLSL